VSIICLALQPNVGDLSLPKGEASVLHIIKNAKQSHFSLWSLVSCLWTILQNKPKYPHFQSKIEYREYKKTKQTQFFSVALCGKKYKTNPKSVQSP
jgi:hypothetical protein